MRSIPWTSANAEAWASVLYGTPTGQGMLARLREYAALVAARQVRYENGAAAVQAAEKAGLMMGMQWLLDEMERLADAKQWGEDKVNRDADAHEDVIADEEFHDKFLPLPPGR